MLYFIATPIGNLGDMSYRAVETLKSVDIIACEDTRNSKKLLSHFDINKPLIAYHKFNEKTSAMGIVELLKEGKNVAVISDGGMPLISDPGHILTQLLKENNLDFTVVPGANAALCALILSGIDTTRFIFVGFLPEKEKDRDELLLELERNAFTLIFHVSCHNIKKDISDIGRVLGNRKASLVKEITKIHEKTYDFNLLEDVEFDEHGEFILVVEGNNKKINKNNIENNNKNNLKIQVENLEGLGISRIEAIKLVAKENKIKKDEVYKLFHKN